MLYINIHWLYLEDLGYLKVIFFFFLIVTFSLDARRRKQGVKRVSTFSVDQKLRQVEELWDELFDIRHGLVGRQTPRGVHGVERSVRNIKALVCETHKTFHKFLV